MKVIHLGCSQDQHLLGGVEGASLGRADAEPTCSHSKWFQQTSCGALELGWPLQVIPNADKWTNP